MSTSSRSTKKPSWFQRRHNRMDMAVFGALLAGDSFFMDIQRRIGGGSSTIYPALDRLVRRGMVGRTRPLGTNARTEYYVEPLWVERYKREKLPWGL